MTDAAELILVGFMKLSADEKQDVIDAISDYLKSDVGSRKAIAEGIEKRGRILMGPTGVRCPVCGK